MKFIACLIAFVAATSAVNIDITVVNLSWMPQFIDIHQGDTVRWSWNELITNHSLVEGAALGDCNPIATPTIVGVPQPTMIADYSLTFTTPGTYYYFCGVHCIDGMFGGINVTGFTVTGSGTTTGILQTSGTSSGALPSTTTGSVPTTSGTTATPPVSTTGTTSPGSVSGSSSSSSSARATSTSSTSGNNRGTSFASFVSPSLRLVGVAFAIIAGLAMFL